MVMTEVPSGASSCAHAEPMLAVSPVINAGGFTNFNAGLYGLGAEPFVRAEVASPLGGVGQYDAQPLPGPRHT